MEQEGRKITFGFNQLLLSESATCLNAAEEACRAAAAVTTQRENNGEKERQGEQDEGYRLMS